MKIINIVTPYDGYNYGAIIAKNSYKIVLIVYFVRNFLTMIFSSLMMEALITQPEK